MPPAIRLGPLVFPAELAVLAAAALVGLLAAHLLNRTGRDGRRADVSGVLWGALIVGLLAARLGFVWQYRDPFVQNPLAVLDVRDGGWAGTWGLAAAWIYAVAAMLRRGVPRPAVIGALALATATWLAGGRLLAPPDQPPPALAQLRLQDLNAVPVALSAYQGKPTVVNLWASWCPPCRREMPMMAEMAAANDDVTFLFVNQGERRATIEGYLNDEKLALPNVLLDARMDVPRHYATPGLPVTLFIGADGKLRSIHVGEISREALTGAISRLQME